MTPTPIEKKSSLDSAERASPEVSPVAAAANYSYGQILKSSAIIGGSSVVNIAIGIMRTKAMAIFLGPAGVGLMGLYSSILNLAQSIADMGINGSGVRQIAEAAGSGEPERIARTAIVLRRTATLLGVLGAVLLILFAKQISILTFSNDQHTTAVAALSLALFFLSVSSGQGALIQGMRRIADLAKMGMLGALHSTNKKMLPSFRYTTTSYLFKVLFSFNCFSTFMRDFGYLNSSNKYFTKFLSSLGSDFSSFSFHI